MAKNFPKRPEPHNLEELSERFFNRSLPRDWTTQKIKGDYGIDLRVDIFEKNQTTGLEFLVQLKASQNSVVGDNEKINLKISSYNLLCHKIQVALIAKYVEEENEAYWILLKDIPEPNQNQKTFTVHIPKTNKLSTISWPGIVKIVEQVTRDKLTIRDQMEIFRRNFEDFICPFCGSMLESRIDAPSDDSENDWDTRDIFSCGFQRFGFSIEVPCTEDPRFPKFSDFELEYNYSEKETIFKWTCIAFGKTRFAQNLHLGTASGETKDEVKQEIINKYLKRSKNVY